MTKCSYRVVALVDPREPERPRWLGVSRVDRCDWRPTWEARERLTLPLACWFRELDAAGLAPLERTLLGGMVGLHEHTARRMMREWIAALTATGGHSLVNERPATGGRGHRRPVLMVEPNGSYVIYPSVREAAKAAGIGPPSLRARIRRGHPDRSGRSWL
jgi:hypothetical protein